MKLGRECTSADCAFSQEGREYLPDDASFSASVGAISISIKPGAAYKITRGVQDNPQNFKVELVEGEEPQVSYKKCLRQDCGLMGAISMNLEVLALTGVEVARKTK